MFSKTFFTSALALFLTVQVSAHAIVEPALGVNGKAVRNDVQRPSTAKPCGNTALTAIDSSTAVNAAADGTFSATVTNFNGGRDGSRQVTATVDASGTGQSFVAAQVTKNGNGAPTSTGSEQITASLPAGTKCSGGASGNLCLVSFKTTSGFGSCVVVAQGAAAAGNNAAAAAGNTAAAATGNTAAATGNNATNGNTNAGGRNGGRRKGQQQQQKRAAGTRAARWLRSLEDRAEAEVAHAKRSVLSWVWA